MDKIRLMGKEIEGTVDSRGKWIELTPDELKAQLKPDLRDLRAKDTVWVELKIEDLENGLWAHGANLAIKREMKESDIIAVFPSEPAEQEKELPLQTDKHRNKARELLKDSFTMDVVTRLLTEIDFLKKGQEKEKAELPKEIDIDNLSRTFPPDMRLDIKMCAKKINDLIKVVKEMQEK